MEDNSGSTPNPLNPNVTPPTRPKAEAGPRRIPVAPPTVSSIPGPEFQNTIPSNRAPQTDAEGKLTSQPETPQNSTPTNPLARPMEKAPAAAAPVKKKKTGLIVGAIICLFLAIGCGVTAALLLLAPKSDPVADAMNKLFSGERPANITVNGDIDFEVSDTKSPFSKINLALNSSVVGNSTINSTGAKITATMRGGNEQVELNFQELYTNSGDLYLKLTGVGDVIDALSTRQNILNPDEPECTTDESGQTNCDPNLTEVIDCNGEADCVDLDIIESPSSNILKSISAYTGLVELIDDEWIRISSDELSSFTSGINNQSNLSCLTNLVKGANSSSLAKIYQDNPFISSTDKDLTVASRNNPIYLVQFDDEKFTNFINASSNSSATEELFSCLGYENASVNTDNITEIIKNLPEVYLEIDKNNDVTRIYFATASEDGGTSAKVDINLSYPNTINITEPAEYKDLSTILQDAAKNLIPANN